MPAPCSAGRARSAGIWTLSSAFGPHLGVTLHLQLVAIVSRISFLDALRVHKQHKRVLRIQRAVRTNYNVVLDTRADQLRNALIAAKSHKRMSQRVQAVHSYVQHLREDRAALGPRGLARGAARVL